ncbi:MAG TPA: UvrD-helicase domain-containing protein [Anaerolineales bacterium]|nr:UvrD-helicase domain-containing protein [Anaerolineales bacterium]
MDLLAGLNTQQQQAVMSGLGPVLVMAGPGSGKTRVLTQRIAYLIGKMGVRPYNILAVTFTNKAAREMENRVVSLLGESARGVTLGTFHATCARILRREAEHLPFKANFVIFDEDDQMGLAKRVIADMNIDEKQFRPLNVLNSISNAKNELILPDEYPTLNYRDEVVKRIYIGYQQMLLTNNALDFDDLLLYTAFLLEENQAVRERYARRYEHVLVDEFQDTNLAQYVLLKKLSSFHNNIFAVGDADQSIYRWRGADYRNVLRFEQDFPDAQVILLEQNYRSTQAILDVAMAVINPNPNRTPKKLFTERGEGLKVVIHETYDDRQEASFIVDTTASMVGRQQIKPGDVAIMYRTNAQSRLLEEAFLHAGLPYRLVGAQRFYGRREVKDVIAYMRLAHNPSDELSLIRVLNVPPRGVGDKTLQTLRTQAQKASLTPGNLLLQMGQTPDQFSEAFQHRALSILAGFGELFSRWATQVNELNPLQMMDRILDDTDYHAYIDDGSEEGADRWDNVMELRRLASEYQERTLSEFLENIALVSDQDTIETSTNVPTLLTLHAAKGLEYPVVFIAGLNEGTLPHSRSFDDLEAMQEERRLFYVGITRAKDRLYLVYAQNRSAFGYPDPVQPSRFLDDIPDELLEDTSLYRTLRSSSLTSFDAKTIQWESKLSQKERALTPKFIPGSHVQHPVWGDGMVLSSRIQDDDEIVDIFFEDIGMKRVAASLANLKTKG